MLVLSSAALALTTALDRSASDQSPRSAAGLLLAMCARLPRSPYCWGGKEGRRRRVHESLCKRLFNMTFLRTFNTNLQTSSVNRLFGFAVNNTSWWLE